MQVLENKEKTDPTGQFYQSWQPQIDNIRTAITLHYAEIQENLNALEEFLNNIRHI